MKSYSDWERRNKTPLLSNDMIVYVENPLEPRKVKLIEAESGMVVTRG